MFRYFIVRKQHFCQFYIFFYCSLYFSTVLYVLKYYVLVTVFQLFYLIRWNGKCFLVENFTEYWFWKRKLTFISFNFFIRLDVFPYVLNALIPTFLSYNGTFCHKMFFTCFPWNTQRYFWIIIFVFPFASAICLPRDFNYLKKKIDLLNWYGTVLCSIGS